MHKEKFEIPMPDDETIQKQVKLIVSQGVQPKVSFYSFLREMMSQVGWRHLFSDRLELGLIFFLALSINSLLFLLPADLDVQAIYGAVFLISPLVFLSLSIYAFVNKTENATYEVEMACKYNVYQIVAFRMLVFSIIAIVTNTIVVSLVVMHFPTVEFLRAYMISTTSLFLFSVLFLYALMGRHSRKYVIGMVSLWLAANLSVQIVDANFYSAFLIKTPLVVYAIVNSGCLYGFGKSIKRFAQFKQMEGVLFR
ncbi:hypothetical protein [Sporosarcina sp. Te-1]|uniref:hypothetical protein n=1 Tax=Sporosarcina sp. Te-1 TaxID=2818390 RepID=UPI001A9DF628|nr:hypothetical protein [Sporosarcina sp. Te-1]QTD41264.1 hypothetical protein J3U78_21530 [Sporosarcina sp. Te-1]